jgi:hypothetical protein
MRINEANYRLRLASWKCVARSHLLRGMALPSVALNTVAALAREMGKPASAIPTRYARTVAGWCNEFPHLLRSMRKPQRARRGWIGVDLDGTLAQYHGWRGVDKIGPPVPIMLERVKAWLDAGVDVRIFTARVCRRAHRRIATRAIGDWCEQHGLPRLPVTNVKDYQMIELWDDRAVRVEINVGRRVDERAQRRGRHARPLKRNPLVPASGLVAPYSKAKQKVPSDTKLPGTPQ